MFDYLQQIKEISNSLIAVGATISCCDGLSDEFESFIDSIRLHLSSTSLGELHGLLLTMELSITLRRKVASFGPTEPFPAFSVQLQPPLLIHQHKSLLLKIMVIMVLNHYITLFD